MATHQPTRGESAEARKNATPRVANPIKGDVPRGTTTSAPHTASTLQQRLGNHGTQAFASQVVVAQASPTPAPAPSPPATIASPPLADPGAALIEELANHLLQLPETIDTLELSKPVVQKLTAMANKPKIDDGDLQGRLAALDKKKRAKIVAAAVGQVQAVLGQRRDEKLAELVAEVVSRTKERMVELAQIARDAELQEVEELKEPKKSKQVKKSKLRPQFGVIRKYLLRDTIYPQIDHPRTEPYPLRKLYREALGLGEHDILFPGLHEEDFAAELTALSKSMRKELKVEIAERTLESTKEYIRERMTTDPKAIVEEWESLKEIHDLFEDQLTEYFAVRTEFLNAFGSTENVQETIETIKHYFTEVLVKTGFLEGVKGSGRTRVHPQFNEALKSAEKFIDQHPGWRAEILKSTKKFAATNIRENRPNPARPSEHSYGFAIDIDDDFNPNLSGLTRPDWEFIAAMVGSGAMKGTQVLANPSKGTEAEMLAAMTQIRVRSDTFKSIFASDSSLRTRLHQMLSAGPAGQGKTAAEIDSLVDFARAASQGGTKDRQQAWQSLQTALQEAFFKQQPIASEPIGPDSALRKKLVKLLAPNLRELAQTTAAEAAIRSQIVTPADKPTADAKRQGFGVLFAKNLVKELSGVPAGDRTELVRQVLRDLRAPLVRKGTDTEARALAGVLKRSFELLDQTTDKKGNKVGPGSGMRNVAVHGFSNLNEKLVVALVHPQGGNLEWLGVVFKDMHHFQLRGKLPSLPKATATKSSSQPVPSTLGPQPSGSTAPTPEP